jgi:hypothetical protein
MKARVLICVAVVLLMLAPAALADPVALRLTAGAVVINVADNGVGDLDPTLGVILWNGPVGPDWAVRANTTTGVMDPSGSPLGSIDLNSVNNSNKASTLTLEFSRTGVNIPANVFEMEIGGTSTGSVRYDAYLDPLDVAFGGALLGTLQFPAPAGAFSGAQMIGASGVPLYSLTQKVTLNVATAGNASFDALLAPVPEPATGILVGLGILALGRFLRRRAV